MNKITPQDWAVIINPKSGKNHFREQRKYLFLALEKAGIVYDYRYTRFEGHAINIARLFAGLHYRNFLVVGGDGTLSEVINGIFSAGIENTASCKIALIPRGTGNDWGRFWGLSRDYKHSIETFLNGKVHTIDIGKLEYEVLGARQTRYFINSVGLGLDAKVTKSTHHLRRYLGSHSFLYTVALLGTVFSYHAHRTKLQSLERNIDDSLFTMSVANGCYSGGGMKQTPNALPYDGLLDVMLAKKPGFRDIVGALRMLFNGKLLEHPIIESFQTQNLEVDCHSNVLMEADGIILNGKSPYVISIIPNAIQMIVP